MKKFYFLFAFISVAFWGHAQYLHFSQFDLSPLTVNPGSTGFHDGNWRVSAIHRNQWYGFKATVPSGTAGNFPFITNSLGFDMPFYIYNHRVSAGIMVTNDQSSNLKFSINQIYLSGAYEKRFGGHLFSFGIQPGYVYKGHSDGQIYPNQYDREMGEFNSKFESGESKFVANYGFFDLNAGVVYKRLFGRITPEIGIAVDHLNMPKESFFDDDRDNRLSLRETFHFKLNIPVGADYFVTPTALVMEQARSTQWTLGSAFGMNFSEENSLKLKNVFVGARFRNGFTPDLNALMPFVGAEINNFRIGFNYDVDLSSFNPASNYEGAYEIGIIYISPSTRFSKITIPCDRY